MNWFEKKAISRRTALLGSAAVATATASTALLTGRAAAETMAGMAGEMATGQHGGHAGLGARLMSGDARRRLAMRAPANVAESTETLPEPKEVHLGHLTAHKLVMKPYSGQLGTRQAKNLRVYDSGTPYMMAPTLVMKQTGRFKVDVVNKLGLNPDQDQAHIVNIPSQFNTTNLHTHGLHVSPEGRSDNVYLEILPEGTAKKYAHGETTVVGHLTYDYHLENHTPGTFWYHPHRHGSVAVQVASGAAGALIVRGGPGTVDAVPEIAAAKEKVLLIQQVVLDNDGALPDFDTLWNYAATGAAATWTVNGTVGANTAMQPGEVQRWRIVNTGFQAETKFAVKAADGTYLNLTLIAMDGINFTETATVQAVYLPPGGRADIMVQAPNSQTTLTAEVGRYIRSDGSGSPLADDLRAGFKINGQWQEAPFNGEATDLFYVKVGGAIMAMTLPSGALPAPIVPDLSQATPDDYRFVYFDLSFFPEQVGGSSTNGTYNPNHVPVPWGPCNIVDYRPWACQTLKFQINGELFCPGRVMFQPKLGSVDEYYVATPGLHVFHIHVNPFLVKEVAGAAVDVPMWRDTMFAGPRGYRALTRYTDYPGTFPIHCHILDHEDVGMMTNVTVVNPANPAASYPKADGHGH